MAALRPGAAPGMISLLFKRFFQRLFERRSRKPEDACYDRSKYSFIPASNLRDSSIVYRSQGQKGQCTCFDATAVTEFVAQADEPFQAHHGQNMVTIVKSRCRVQENGDNVVKYSCYYYAYEGDATSKAADFHQHTHQQKGIFNADCAERACF
jgi:hypothetical protein